MSVFAMIAGKLVGEPVTRPTKNGGKVTFFRLRVANGNALEFWSAATFSDDHRALLDGLGEGAPMSVTGAFVVEPWDRGEKRGFNLRITADTVTSFKATARARKAKPTGREIASNSWASPAGPRQDAPIAEVDRRAAHSPTNSQAMTGWRTSPRPARWRRSARQGEPSLLEWRRWRQLSRQSRRGQFHARDNPQPH